MIDIIKKLAGAVLGGVYGYLAAAGAGAALAGGLTFWIMDMRLDVAVSAKKLAEQSEQTAQGDLKQCRAAAERQNQAIADLEERARRAAQAMEGANVAREAAEQRANEILREREPAGHDECTAARNAFDAELRKERER